MAHFGVGLGLLYIFQRWRCPQTSRGLG